MRELLEQASWSMRSLIQREYDARKNTTLIRTAVIIALPILASYIIAHSNNDNATFNGDKANDVNISLTMWIWSATIGGLASFLLNIWQAILRLVGVTLGVGLGLGLAGHVYDVLSDAHEDKNTSSTANRNKDGEDGVFHRRNSASNLNNSKPNFPKEHNARIEDANSYHSLMRSAGYNVDNRLLRAQMVRGEEAAGIITANNAKRSFLLFKDSERKEGNDATEQLEPPVRPSLYKFNNGTTASTQMKRMWPNLSPMINDALAKLTEFVLRDYVSSWYAKVDEHVVYTDPSVVGAVNNDAASTMGTATATVEGDTISSSRDGTRRPSTAPQLESSLKQRQMASSLTTPNSDVGTVTSSTRGRSDNGRLRSVSDLSKSSNRPRTSHSELRSSHTSLSTSTPTTIATDPTRLQSPYAIHSPHSSSEALSKQDRTQQQRTMVLTTTGTQSSPFIDSLYTAFAYLLGMMATRSSENVNILEVLLLRFPHVLAQNLRVYREMKQVALEKKRRKIRVEREKWRRGQMEAVRDVTSEGEGLGGGGSVSSGMTSMTGSIPTNTEKELQSEDVSEIAIVREYLLAGRLHAALTFGMDVPSLLFADPLGKDCPPGPSYKDNNDLNRQKGFTDEDAILENRLLSTESSLIAECELDYNRVLACKIAKLVVTKNEMESSVVRSMLVEMLASCVLCPSMGCFSPDYVNGWLIKGLSLLEPEVSEGDNATSALGTTSPAAMSEENPTDSLPRRDSQEALVFTNQSVVSDLDVHAHDSLSGLHPINSGENEDKTLTLDGIVDGVVEEIITSDGSVRSEMDDMLFEEDYADDAICNDSEQIITLLSMSIIELGRFVDFEDCRYARERNEDVLVDWDQANCQKVVQHLVLVIEAALLLGARLERRRIASPTTERDDLSVMENLPEYDDGFEVEIYESETKTSAAGPSPGLKHSTLSAALMELTGDIDAFEKITLDTEHDEIADDTSVDDTAPVPLDIPKPNELSTLRTLIAAWLHTGQAFRVLSIIAHAKTSILVPFYHSNAFLRKENYVSDFTRLMRQLDGVEILVDTHSVLASQCILVGNGFDSLMQSFQHDFVQKQDDPFPQRRGRSSAKEPRFSQGIFGQKSMVGSMRAKSAQNFNRIARFAQSASESFQIPFDEISSSTSKRPFSANIAFKAQNNNHSTPAYLDFNKNSTFSSSLRSERERRHGSWVKEISGMEKVEFFGRTRAIKDKDALVHRELHHLSRFFYTYTSEMRIESCPIPSAESGSSEPAANLIVKGVSARRKLEVPDEDSSFLLRVQAKPLKPASIHRDQRNPNLSCKIYFAMYEEPAIHPRTK